MTSFLFSVVMPYVMALVLGGVPNRRYCGKGDRGSNIRCLSMGLRPDLDLGELMNMKVQIMS